ncbi:patatin-like phospholipase family protein [Thalassomonas sp. M1454]|uniref:patatin-like phospholipase family protein n=1 Tax=Thalassomonas sp. M1454 TaxID=2594477 RepID=UPI00117C5390|nr:patatin-like phospholipase family protein [Thalassomonas sp. M1454]TRX55641.1 patatin-like phospholipase family protein [Thalassomonas sp. M1454]
MVVKKSYKGCKTALLLTGGGASAAYQVGVLKAITKFMPRNHGIPFPIISGTSAGAINATTLACYASCFHLGMRRLEYIWNNLHTDQIYDSSSSKVFGHIIKSILGSYQAGYAAKKPASLLNNDPLRRLLTQVVDFKRIDGNIANGYLSSIAITAASYTSGDSISFYQADKSIAPWQRSKRRGIQTQLNTEHLMASSAIPFIFPSVKIKKEHYGDGSVSQLSPLSTPIHLGAEKIFIIGVEQPSQQIHHAVDFHKPPSSASIAGHLMDTVFTEALNSDLERMHRVNDTVKLIDKDVLAQQSTLKQVDSFVLNPTKNFHVLANDHYDELTWALRLILRMMGAKKDAETTLTSYIMFEKNYCKKLIAAGFDDAMEQESQIREFLNI